ncbi:MAG: IclR family transcriptional regulator C-terminal domain-containing protein [Pseudomonadota bacterium]
MPNKKITPALARAQGIFYALLRSPWPMGISELARSLDIGKSTVHGLVHSLLSLGLLEKDPDSPRSFRPSDQLIQLWRQALLEGDLRRAARPLLQDFGWRHNLTALAGVFLQARVLIVEAVLAPGFSISAYPGQWVPAWAAALGKLLLADLPDKPAQALAQRMSAAGPLSKRQYLAEAARAKAWGVAVDREEYIPGVRALAAAVPPASALEPLGAVWVVGLAPALDEARLELLGPELKALAEEVGRRMYKMEKEGLDAGSQGTRHLPGHAAV